MTATQRSDIRREINPARDGAVESVVHPPELPAFPCGWIERPFPIGDRTLRLMLPYRPDSLLDDLTVLAKNERDDYMPYWAYLWPAALHMFRAVMTADWPAGARVLELGCGVGLVGLAALARGGHVDLTDYEQQSVTVAEYNARLNGFQNFSAFTLDWRQPPRTTYPIILGCDLLYEQRNLVPILDLLEVMLEPGGICWLADGGRHVAHQFWYLARERGYNVTMRGVDGQELSMPGLHYQIFELCRTD